MQYRARSIDRAAGPAMGIALLFALAGCGEPASDLPATPGPDDLSPAPGPGVIFTYPHHDQQDVPVGARIAVGLTSPVDLAALHADCRVDAAGAVSGTFCVMGPDGPVRGTLTPAGSDDTAIHFQPDALQPGTTYEVYVQPAVMGARATNLPADRPLFSFHTRQERIRGGERPVVSAVNGEAPEAFVPGSGVSPRFPVASAATLRVLLSEPIAPQSVVPGDTFALVAVDPDSGEERRVEGNLLVQGIHLVFDPAEDLIPGIPHRLRLSDGIHDLGGEPLVAATFELTPVATHDPGASIAQVLAPWPAQEDTPAVSPMTGAEANTIQIASPLIGDTTLAVTGGHLHTELADPARFGTRIPLVLRRGQTLALSGLDVALGGEIPLSLHTGDIQVHLLSDATGFLTRNPYRDEAQPPHDREAPVTMYLTLDVAVTADDETGNAVLNQTVLGLQAVGVVTAEDGALVIDALAAMELDLLGVTTVPANLALRLQTAPEATAVPDTEPPRLVATYPAPGQDSFPVDHDLRLTFSRPLAADQITAQQDVVLTTGEGTPVDFLLTTRGSTLILSPQQPLAYGTDYTLALPGTLRDLVGNPWEPAIPAIDADRRLRFATPVLSDDPTPPLMTMLYPGVPCALTDPGPGTPGPCQGGQPRDSRYLPFELPADRNVEIAFDKPMDPATLVRGTACNTGSVRIESIDAAGACVGAVPGVLTVRERGLRFVPEAPWTPGQTYRITLVAGGDQACDPGEICGQNGLPLNTTPLRGTTRDQGGGPPATIAFTAAPATDDTLVVLSTMPHTDVNGNGFVDPDEIPRDQNRVAVAITGTSGIVTSARIDQPDCLPETPQVEGCVYLTAELPASLGATRTNCTIGQDEQGAPITVDRCVPVRIYPQILFGTALIMDADVVFLGRIEDLQTGRLVMRLREGPNAPITGYIIDGPGGSPRFVVDLDLYMDAPDLVILGGLASHDLRSKPVSLSLAGPLTFLDDGRLALSLTNTRATPLQVNVAAALGGSIDLQLPANTMSLRLVSTAAAARAVQGRLP